MTKNICLAISSLTHAIREFSELRKNEFEWFKSHHELATKQDLANIEAQIMSAISEFAEKQNAFTGRVDAAIAGLEGDVQSLNEKIAELQNTPGTITPEDQALLDAIQSRSETIATKLEALDALTPPKPPVG
jgi:chromosome segregation ATPase